MVPLQKEFGEKNRRELGWRWADLALSWADWCFSADDHILASPLLNMDFHFWVSQKRDKWKNSGPLKLGLTTAVDTVALGLGVLTHSGHGCLWSEAPKTQVSFNECAFKCFFSVRSVLVWRWQPWGWYLHRRLQYHTLTPTHLFSPNL